MWDKLKGAIFEADPAEEAKNTAPPAPSAGTQARTAAVMSGMAAGVNPEFVAAVRKAVFSKTTALTSLVQAADSLAEIIPDPTTRFKAAFKTAGAGRTVQQIAAAADIHLADIEGEELRFKAAVDAKLGAEIQQHEAQAAQAAQGVQSTQQLIENLQRQITEAQARIGQLSQAQAEHAAAAMTKKSELQLTSDQFKAAAASVRNEIQALRQSVLTSLS